MSGQRIEALDAIRGIAALLVVFSHVYATLPGALRWSLALERTPLSILVLGRPAVILFFVLSGFVLSLSLMSPRAPSYAGYIVRRFCRIYLPFASVILAAAVARELIQPAPIDQLSAWFNRDWMATADPSLLLRHLAMLGRAEDMTLNNPIWSLVVEMRISMFFPLLLLLAGRNLAMAGAATLMTLAAAELIARSPWLPRVAYSNESPLEAVLFTLYFVPFFVIGILLATQRERIVGLVGWLGPRSRGLLWLLALAGMSIERDVVNGVAAGLIIALTLGSPGIRAVLEQPVLQWLGRVSYSLYLTHMVVLLSVVHLWHGTLPLPVLLVAVIPLSLIVAQVTHVLVERPAMQLGRQLTRPARQPAIP